MNKYDLAIAEAVATGMRVKGDNFIVLPKVTTTMRIIDDAIKHNKPVGYTAIALEQTEGQGGRDPATGKPRTWWSHPENLKFSQIIPMAAYEHPKEIAMVAAEALGTVVGSLVAGRQYKFINDVLIDGAKVGGLLVRHRTLLRGNLGVGVNIVAAPPAEAMREDAIIQKATSLRDHGATGMTSGKFLAMFEEIFSSALADYRNTRDLTTVFERMGFAEPGTGLITFKGPAPENRIVTGHYDRFITHKNDHGVYADYLCLRKADGKVAEVPVVPEWMIQSPARRDTHQQLPSEFRHG